MQIFHHAGARALAASLFLIFSSATLAADGGLVQIADRVDESINIISADGVEAESFEIYRPGASFIKVHFGNFSIPAGVVIEVTNADGSESYRYSKHKRDAFTFNAAEGEDGRKRFSALSVLGDTAIINVIGARGNIDKRVHRVLVDYFMEGYPEADVEYLMNNGGRLDKGDLTANTESTCGVNERRDVACWENSHPVEFERTRPVARILINGSSLCTAWRVGPDNRMFTNNHCVDTQSGVANTEVWFNYQRNSCGGSLAQRTTVTGSTLLETDFTLDYSLFTVNNFAAIQSFGYMGLDPREATPDERIYIAQHGSGNPKELAIEDDQSSTGLCKVDAVSQNGYGTNTDMGYFCDTIGGSSGSPVLAASSNRAIALHHFGGCENGGVKIVRIWPQVASYFGNQVPAGDNEGPGGNIAPTASFTFNCNGLSCSFDASGSSDSDGSIVSYAWDFGDSNSGSGVNDSNVYGAAGAYTVELTVTDDDGDSGVQSQVVQVSDPSSNPPAAPTNLTASVSTSGKGRNKVRSVILNWNDNANNEDSYIVERCQETGKGRNKVCNFAPHATLPAGSTSYSEGSLSGTNKYRVKARNGNGDSGYSNEVKV